MTTSIWLTETYATTSPARDNGNGNGILFSLAPLLVAIAIIGFACAMAEAGHTAAMMGRWAEAVTG